MQSQDATSELIFRLWPWIEANKNKIIGGATIITVVIFAVWFYASQRQQKEVVAGQALAQTFSIAGVTADAYQKIAEEYPDTLAAQRALLQTAALLFASGRYADAQTQFQKFLDTYPDNDFVPQATLGIAASLDAQGNTDLAVGAYQRAVNTGDAMTVNAAKFALARIDEQQGRISEAMNTYEEVARANPSGTLGSEAAMRLMELKAKIPAAPVANTPNAPFTLTH